MIVGSSGLSFIFLVNKARRRAELAIEERLRERRAAELRREEAIRHGGAPGQLSEATSQTPDGALSQVEEPGALSLPAGRKTTTN